ncbi:glutamyl-tRNA synthetase [Plasticicumulans lactativorans]|uniref:Glutamate--tRNA ligase n=1 Tax=Plasticicumulans lactativorans TaxID=1133106 RepID=A0A4R2L6T2_9GAMM|nr:glutamate--tRNA ligase [Plasticicumulans lactativorans]TCO80987.1 glutamyl-tRNA synthetase [Plasticicumulans lactativorans]
MVKTRFAPSPTGFLHIGGARTALFSWLHARHHGGRTVLRIEDTDLERSTPEAVQAILDSLDWLGLDHDEGPYYQTRRFDRYREVIAQMLAAGTAYHCYCSKEEVEQMREAALARKEKPRYDGRWRPAPGKALPPPPPGVAPVVRFRNPAEGVTVVDDLIHGRIEFDNRELDDLVIARPDGTPTYNFCVVVDDMDMGITHVVRGDDHINNTPRQINILAALGAAIPRYAHVPMILGDDGLKLSKRHGAVSVTQYRDEGYLPEAVVNYLVRLGWSHGDQELFSREEMIRLFDASDVNKAASAFNTGKLRWLNQQYLMQADPLRLATLLRPHLAAIGIEPEDTEHLVEVVKAHVARAQTLVELAEVAAYVYREFDHYEAKSAKDHLKAAASAPLRHVRDALAALPEWSAAAIHAAVEASAAALDLKLGKVAQPLRVAVCGRAASPGIDVTLWLVGRQPVLQRIDRALAYLDRGND